MQATLDLAKKQKTDPSSQASHVESRSTANRAALAPIADSALNRLSATQSPPPALLGVNGMFPPPPPPPSGATGGTGTGSGISAAAAAYQPGVTPIPGLPPPPIGPPPQPLEPPPPPQQTGPPRFDTGALKQIKTNLKKVPEKPPKDNTGGIDPNLFAMLGSIRKVTKDDTSDSDTSWEVSP